MSLNKNIICIIEWIAALLLASVCTYFYIFSFGSFSADGAYRASEKTYHYGPSQIKRVVSFENEKLYFGKYKDWISATSVQKKLIKWFPGNGVGGFPINYSDKIIHYWFRDSIENNSFIRSVYGYVNDSAIKTVNLQIEKKVRKVQ